MQCINDMHYIFSEDYIMNQAQQPEIGKSSRTLLLHSQLELSVKYLISDSLTDEKRDSVIKSLANGKNIPMELNQSLYNTIDFFINMCNKHRVRFESCLLRKGNNNFAFYHLFFRNEQCLKDFFSVMEWPLRTIDS